MSEKVNVLVIEERVPEETFVRIVPMTKEQFDIYSGIGGFIVNSDDFDEEQEKIYEELSELIAEYTPIDKNTAIFDQPIYGVLGTGFVM